MTCPTVIYHAIGSKPVGGAPMTLPTFPHDWQRAYNVYETTWTSEPGGVYTVDVAKLRLYLAQMQNPTADIANVPDQHSAGRCDPGFTGPIVLDMERQRMRAAPAAFSVAMREARAAFPRARLSLYATSSKWSAGWDTPATAAGYQSDNDADNAAVDTFDKHVPLYIKDASAAASWENWNERNAAEAVRAARRTGGQAFAWASPSYGFAPYDPITDAALMLAQVRPAIKVGMNMIVWDYFYTTADRDNRVSALGMLASAIEQARRELWRA